MVSTVSTVSTIYNLYLVSTICAVSTIGQVSTARNIYIRYGMDRQYWMHCLYCMNCLYRMDRLYSMVRLYSMDRLYVMDCLFGMDCLCSILYWLSIRYPVQREGSNKWPYCSHVPTVIEVRAEIYAAGRSCSTPIAPSSTRHDRGVGYWGEGATTPPDFPDREKIPEIDNLMSPPNFWTFRRHWLCMHSYIAWLYTAATIAQ